MTRIHTSVAVLVAALVLGCRAQGPAGSPLRVAVTFPSTLHADPITGRVFVLITRDSGPEPRELAGGFGTNVAMYGVDVSALKPGEAGVVSDTTPGFPLATLRDIPAGDYWVQAVLNVYTEFHRADGHTIWAHMDQWEGQHFATSPGNLVSDVRKVHLDPSAGYNVDIALARALPPVTMPPDTKWVKHIKIESKLLSAFWGHPMYLGATVLLPKGYDEHPTAHYPTIYEQGHFNLRPPFGFSTDSQPIPPERAAMMQLYNLTSGYALYRQWDGPGFPRMIAVTFQHPTPYFDDSYAVNSANDGPYGDAILQELIPYLESHYRMIPKSYARVLTGGSTGGWESIALQIYHPDVFGGTWTLYPDPVDFRHYDMVDAYADTNAFSVGEPGSAIFSPVSPWFHPERILMRGNDGQPFMTERQFSAMEDVLGSHGRSAQQLEAWEAVYGPVGADGYPQPLWDKRTGHIDHNVATYMRDHGFDLRAYLAAHWATVGPQLVDKLRVDVGDMDNFYLNLAVYDMQAFLDTSTAPHVTGQFQYGRPERGHGWQHTNNAAIMREMSAAIQRHTPAGENRGQWQY
jgi:Putative esterase